jgi:hypothetical protein
LHNHHGHCPLGEACEECAHDHPHLGGPHV